MELTVGDIREVLSSTFGDTWAEEILTRYGYAEMPANMLVSDELSSTLPLDHRTTRRLARTPKSSATLPMKRGVL
jgi:hypothetical protein